MTSSEQIIKGFFVLRELCDPRGHGVLLALQDLCVVEARALEAVLERLSAIPEPPSNVIPLVRDYGVKV